MVTTDLWTTPEHFPLRIAPAENYVLFVPLSRDLYRTLAFLDARYVSLAESWQVPLDVLIRGTGRVERSARRPVHCIFHVAFCGSTLISRCLDRLPTAMVLKEPFPIHELAHLKRHGPATPAHVARWQASFDLLLQLLGRTFDSGQVAIVKPTDASTHLIGDVLTFADASGALFLYVALEEFLISLLSDEVRRGFVWHRLDDLFVLCAEHPRFRDVEWRALSDAEQAACLWMLHLHLYVGFAQAHPDARCRALDFAAFLGQPRRGLAAVARLFGIATTLPEIEAAIAAELAVHSKEREVRFTPADRVRSRRASAEKLRGEIDAGLAWAERRLAEHPFPTAPPLTLEFE